MLQDLRVFVLNGGQLGCVDLVFNLLDCDPNGVLLRRTVSNRLNHIKVLAFVKVSER